MANYSYVSRAMRRHRWIANLRIVNGTSVSASHWTEIHFTEPKKAQVQSNLRPHVTFELRANGNKSHWYLKNAGGSWVLERGGAASPDGQLEREIAYNVLADALDFNWILQAPPSVVKDDEGFSTVETKRGRRTRMQTQWQNRR